MYIEKVKTSIPCFFILAGTFLSLLFLMRLVIKNHIDDTVKDQIVLKDYQQTRWGSIPGAYDYKQSKSIEFYSLQQDQKNVEELKDGPVVFETLNFKKQDPLNFAIQRDYANMTYIPQQGAISVTEQYQSEYKSDLNKMAAQTYTHLNVGALSLWYQMTTRPDYFKTFQALSKIRQEITSFTLPRLQAYHSFYYAFNNKDLVVKSYLRELTAEKAEAVYSDSMFGLDHYSKLFYWFLALRNDQNAILALNTIKTNFQSKNIILTNDDLMPLWDQICYEHACCYYYDNMFAIQWSGLGVVSNDNIRLSPNAPHIQTYQDLDPDNIANNGEFSYYVQFVEKSTTEQQMDPTAVQNLFLLTPTYANLMNPANLQVFYEKYQEQNYNAIIKRFQIASNDQIDSLMGYFKYITARFVTYEDRGGDYEVNTFARLMLKAIDLSYNSLLTQVPFELAARYITAYNEVNKKTCINYASIAAPTDQARQQALCKGFNFLNLQDVKIFLRPTYFQNPDDITSFKQLTTMTDAEFALFFGADPNSFQSAYITQLQNIHDDQKCTTLKNNCTAEELANIQWGSSGVTLLVPNAYQKNQYFSSPSKSVFTSWNLGKSPCEYYYYISEVLKIEEPIIPSTVGFVLNNITGITTDEKATIMVINITAGNNISTYTDNLKIKNAQNFLTCLRYLVQNYLLGSPIIEKSANDWIKGYKADFINVVTAGDFFQGNDKDLTPQITPLMNEFNPSVTNQEMRIDTGALEQERISRVRQINLKPYLNIQQNIYNGTGYVQAPVNPWYNRVSLNDMTNGLQYKPEINEGTLNQYDNVYMRNFVYKYSEDTTFQQNDQSILAKTYTEKVFNNGPNKYSSTNPSNTIDIGPSFNLPVVASKQGGLNVDETLLKKIQLDGQDFLTTSVKSDTFKQIIEPFSGFLMQRLRVMTVFLNLNQAKPYAFPTLDNIGQQMIPLYDLTDTLSIDAEKFSADFGFIQTADKSRKSILVAFIVLTCVFFVFGVISTIVYCLKKDQIKGSVHENNHLTSDFTGNQDSDKKYNKLLS
eukprot:403350176